MRTSESRQTGSERATRLKVYERGEANGLILRMWEENVLMWMLASERRKDLTEGKETVKEESQDPEQ